MWPFGSNGGGKISSKEMRIQLATQCSLPYPESESFLTASQDGKMAGRKVTNFRIFRATGVPAEDKRGFNDLSDDSILYDGIREKDGTVTVGKGRKVR